MPAKLTFTRYRVTQSLPPKFQALFDQAVKSHVAVPINPEGIDERAMGWCQHGDELNLRPEWRHGDCVVLDMRVETLKIPSKELKRLVRSRKAELEKEEGKPLSMTRAQELKDLMKADLRKKVPSKISVVPFLWDIERKRVYFFSQNGSACDSFLLLFGNTFKLPIDMEGREAWSASYLDELGGKTDEVHDLFCAKFLTWLFWQSSIESKLFRFQVRVGAKIRLALGDAEMVVDSDPDQARAAIAQGYNVRELHILFIVGEREWEATLSPNLHVKGAVLPAILTDGIDEETLERAQLLSDLDDMIWQAFRRYLATNQTSDSLLIEQWAKADRVVPA